MSVLIKNAKLQQVMRVIVHSTEWLPDDIEIVEVPEPQLNEEQMQELLREAHCLYGLYDLIGTEHVSEEDWVFAYIEGLYPKLIKRIEEQEHERG